VQNRKAAEEGLAKSLFQQLFEKYPNAVAYLYQQYRMNDDIMALANRLFYENKLIMGLAYIGERKLVFNEKEAAFPQSDWLKMCIQPENSVVFLDTDNLGYLEKCSKDAVLNDTEADLVGQVLFFQSFIHFDCPRLLKASQCAASRMKIFLSYLLTAHS
jgi:DNA replication ATP-dependent helicase Dna2